MPCVSDCRTVSKTVGTHPVGVTYVAPVNSAGSVRESKPEIAVLGIDDRIVERTDLGEEVFAQDYARCANEVFEQQRAGKHTLRN
jgi:hypothetical protein